MRRIFFENLPRLRRAYAEYLDPVCEKWQLTRNETDLLLFLSQNPSLDRAADYVALRGATKSQVSKSVAHLEQLGFLSRSLDPNDRRSARIVVTESGRLPSEDANRALDQFEARLFEQVAPEELAAFETMSEKITANIARMGF